MIRRRLLHVAVTSALAAMLLMLVASCGGGAGGGAQTSGQQDKPQVLVLLPSLQDESYVRQRQGAMEEAKEHPNVSFEVDAGSERSSATSVINKIETATSRGVDVIAVNPGAFGNEVRPVLQRAANQGVKVLAFDQTVPDMEQLAGYIEVNVTPGAVQAGEFMGEQLSSGDELGVIRCFAGNPVMDARMSGFERGLEGSGVEIVSTLDPKCDPAKARTDMENMLSAHPNLAGVFSDTDVALMGAVEALEAANKDPVVVGFDGQKPALRAIANGRIIDATVTNPFEQTGKMAVQQAAKLAQGEEIPENTDLDTELVSSKEEAQQLLSQIEEQEQ